MSTIGEPITCRAAVLWGPKGDLTVETIQVQPPEPGQVRIKTIASGVCHSDLIDYHEDGIQGPKETLFPYIPGHEGAGIVESIGEGVTRVQPGDSVLLLFFGCCSKCPSCQRGEANYCVSSWLHAQVSPTTDQPPFTLNGKPLYRFLGTSTFSEYTVAEEDRVVKIDSNLDLREACLIACGVPTGYGSAVNLAKVSQDCNTAVWGLGTLGLAAGLGALHKGAKKVIGVDTNPEKFKIAPDYGFTDFVNPKDLPEGKSVPDVIREMTNGLGVDSSVVCVGAPQAMNDAIGSLAPAPTSRAALIGLAPPGSKVSIDIGDFLLGKTVTGGLYGGFKQEDITGLLEMVVSGQIDLTKFITARKPLDYIKDAFEDLIAGRVLRTVIILDPDYKP